MQILTDFSGVLAGGLTGFFRMMSQELDIPVALLEAHLGENAPWIRQLNRGRVTEDEFWDAIVEDFAKKMNGKLLDAEKLKAIFHENMRRQVPGTLDVYSRIAYYPIRVGQGGRVGKGVPSIGIVADCTTELVPLLHEWHPDIFDLIKKEFWSCQHEIVKEDPDFFRLLPKRVRSEDPAELLLVDSRQRNVNRARLAGIPAIQFINAEQLEADMERLGFAFNPKA